MSELEVCVFQWTLHVLNAIPARSLHIFHLIPGT